MYEKQMELFQDGGKVDKASGNDIPLGSTAAEVRDDQPAMLSEGEMVIPADVVRYFGVEHFMNLRDQAKMGYKKMEAMGQFGTDEGQTLPDDTLFNAGGPPFTIEDIEVIEDDMQEKQPIKAADGALIATTLPSIAMGMSSLLDSNGTSTDSQASDSDINDPALAEAAVSTDQTQSTVGTNNFNYLLSFMPDTFKQRFQTAEGEDKKVAEEVEKFVNSNVRVNRPASEQGDGVASPTTTEMGIVAGGGRTTGSIPEMYAVPSPQNVQGLKDWNANLNTSFGRAVLSLSDMFLGTILSAAPVPGPIGAAKMIASLMDPSVKEGFSSLYGIATDQAKAAGVAANTIENFMSNITPAQQQQMIMLAAAEGMGLGINNPNVDVVSIETSMGTQIGTKAKGPLGAYTVIGPYGVPEVVVPDKVNAVLDKDKIDETQKNRDTLNSNIQRDISNMREAGYGVENTGEGRDKGTNEGIEGSPSGIPGTSQFDAAFDVDVGMQDQQSRGGSGPTASTFSAEEHGDLEGPAGGDADPGGYGGGYDGYGGGPESIGGGGFDVADAMGGDAGGDTGTSDTAGDSDGISDTEGSGFKRGGFVKKRKYKKKKARRGLAGR